MNRFNTHLSTQGVLEPEELEAVVASKHPPLLALQVGKGSRQRCMAATAAACNASH